METATQSKIGIVYIFKSILFCVVFTGILVIFSLTKNMFPNSFERLAHGTMGTLAALLTTVLFLKFDRKRFSDIGLIFERMTIVKFFAGMLAGVAIMGMLAAGVIYFSNMTVAVNPGSNVWYFLLMTLPLIPLAFMEELGFRAYSLQILKDKIGIRGSIYITSILFALYHIVNGWTIASIFLGPAIWGLVFGLAAIYSRGIAMPTGIHYAANLTTSALGAKNTAASLWKVEQSGTTEIRQQGIGWSMILPSLVLLIFAVICLELYMRRKNTANSRWQKPGLRNRG
jgi:uncharacterized protein